MLSDMVWRGSFHRHIMTSGGTRATPVRTVQLGKECIFPAMPKMSTIEIQSIAMMALVDTSGICQV